MKVYPSIIVGHAGMCALVEYSVTRGDIYRLVSRRWYWPFYRFHGEPFVGELISGVVADPSFSSYDPSYKAMKELSTGFANLGTRFPTRAAPIAPSPQAESQDADSGLAAALIAAVSTPTSDRDYSNIFDFEARKPFSPGGGGDFGGGGAEGSWKADKPRAEPQGLLDTGTSDLAALSAATASLEPASAPAPDPEPASEPDPPSNDNTSSDTSSDSGSSSSD